MSSPSSPPISAPPNTSVLFTIEESTQIGAARRAATALGHAHGMSSDAVGRLAIIVTEAATNILRHAGHGMVILRALVASDPVAIEVLALDKGPGMLDVARALRDGFSTTGTRGEGLGAIKRLADTFAIHSQRGMGTAIVARVGEARPAGSGERPPSLDDRIGAICVPLRGQVECGDSWRVVAGEGRVAVLVVDGLGHGPEAAAVAAAATAAFAPADGDTADAAVARLDTAIRGGRGAALSVTLIDETERTVQFCGVGNVDARVVVGDSTQYLVPQNGIVGHTMPSLRPGHAQWPVGARLIMQSDGVSSRWRMDAYTGLSNAHPALLAGVIYRDSVRERDDATVLVLADAVVTAAA